MAPGSGLGWLTRLGMVTGISALPKLWPIPSPMQVPTDLLETFVVVIPMSVLLFWTARRGHVAQLRLNNVAAADPLTGVSHRVAWMQRMARALPQGGVLLMMSVEQLHTVNRADGYHTGDLCLMALAQRLREITRKGDVIGRADGTTFGVFLPGATLENARQIGLRLSDGLQVVGGTDAGRLTLAIGCCVTFGDESLHKIVQEAESALVRARMQGIGRLVFAQSALAA